MAQPTVTTNQQVHNTLGTIFLCKILFGLYACYQRIMQQIMKEIESSKMSNNQQPLP